LFKILIEILDFTKRYNSKITSNISYYRVIFMDDHIP